MEEKDKQPEEESRSITFTVMDEEGKPKEMIKLNSEGFYFEGEKVEDKEEVYNRFCLWLASQEEVMEMELERQRKLTDSLQGIMEKYDNQEPSDEPAIG